MGHTRPCRATGGEIIPSDPCQRPGLQNLQLNAERWLTDLVCDVHYDAGIVLAQCSSVLMSCPLNKLDCAYALHACSD